MNSFNVLTTINTCSRLWVFRNQESWWKWQPAVKSQSGQMYAFVLKQILILCEG